MPLRPAARPPPLTVSASAMKAPNGLLENRPAMVFASSAGTPIFSAYSAAESRTGRAWSATAGCRRPVYPPPPVCRRRSLTAAGPPPTNGAVISENAASPQPLQRHCRGDCLAPSGTARCLKPFVDVPMPRISPPVKISCLNKSRTPSTKPRSNLAILVGIIGRAEAQKLCGDVPAGGRRDAPADGRDRIVVLQPLERDETSRKRDVLLVVSLDRRIDRTPVVAPRPPRGSGSTPYQWDRCGSPGGCRRSGTS